MKKKLFSLIMAVAMIASLAVPAFAASPNVTGKGQQSRGVNLDGMMALAEVKVTLPESGKAILNPYKLKVSLSGDSISAVSGDSMDDQILSASHEIKNQTAAPMKVGVKIKVTPSSGLEMSATPCTGQETTKSVFMFAEMLYGGTSQQTDTTAHTKALLKEWTDPAKVNEACYPQIIASGDAEKENANFFTVPEASDAAPNYLYWTLRGNTALAPENRWGETDKVTTVVTFSFTPDVLTYIATTSDSTAGVASVQVGKGISAATTAAAGNLDAALAGTETVDIGGIPQQAVTAASMGTIIRIVAKPALDPTDANSKAGVISTVEVKDLATNTKITTTKVNAGLYYFAAPTPGHNVSVKITGTPAT